MSVITLLVVNGCNEIESVFRGENLRTVQASFEDKTTRVSLVPAANSADMITKWQQDDRIHVILMNGTQYIDVGRVPVRDISENGKSCIFQYALPKELESVAGYGLSCFTDICSPEIIDGDVYYNASLMRMPISQFKARVMFDQYVEEENCFGSFTHYGTYELLHVTNNSDKDISFSLCGFEADLRWYKEVGGIRLFDKSMIVDFRFEKTEKSPTITIPAHSSDIIVSWYIPNGNTIQEATLVAEIDGEFIHSTNTISSNVTLCTGIAYHMYVTWNGGELKFEKVNDLLDELGIGIKRLEMEEDEGYALSTGREGHLSFDSTNPSVATAVETDDIGEPHVDILAHSIGTAVITITDTNTGQKSQIEVVVSERIHYAVMVEVGETECVTMKNASGNYEAYSEDVSLATCEVSGNKIYVTGVKNGETTIHVTETGTNKQYIISVKVYGGTHGSAESETFTVNGVSFNMIAVEGGTYWMGAADDDPDADDEDAEGERPRHKVTLDSFSIGQTEVTQALWIAVMGSNPSDHQGSDYPVEEVSWYDCQEFIAKLNNLTGRTFRLPTEAEWEYAARGGKYSQGYKYAGSDDFEEVAWCYNNYNYNGYTHPVATKKPNELGLYDMSGNVFELCQDWYDDHYYQVSPQYNPMGPSSGTRRVSRGGMYRANRFYCRVTFRESEDISRGSNHFGLRLVLSDGGVPQPTAYLTCPDENHPHLIDLGLPSGTLWACCNVGATTPEGYGDYFAWGETSPKDVYSWSTYIHCDGSESSCHDICEDIGGTNHDAAAVNWDEQWKMPSHAQIQELKDNCSSIWTSQNGVNGRRFIGKNNGTIFLPAASCRDGSDIGPIGTNGFYWSSSHCLNVNKDAWALGIYPDNASYPVDVYGDFRCFGLSVRPVKNSGNTSVSEGDEL